MCTLKLTPVAGQGDSMDERESQSRLLPRSSSDPSQVFSGEKTQLSDDFTEYEKQIEVHRLGIER